jgi:hypothetical protein
MKVNKTDATDAEGLAHLVRTGCCQAVSCWAYQWRLRTNSRLLKTFGRILPMRFKITE